jgi:hypothetical protein
MSSIPASQTCLTFRVEWPRARIPKTQELERLVATRGDPWRATNVRGVFGDGVPASTPAACGMHSSSELQFELTPHFRRSRTWPDRAKSRTLRSAKLAPIVLGHLQSRSWSAWRKSASGAHFPSFDPSGRACPSPLPTKSICINVLARMFLQKDLGRSCVSRLLHAATRARLLDGDSATSARPLRERGREIRERLRG